MGEHVPRLPKNKRFTIWVAGRLSEGLAEDVGAVALLDADGGTALTGPFVDQSQIYGILNRLWQLGIEVVRFETDEPSNEGEPTLDAETEEE